MTEKLEENQQLTKKEEESFPWEDKNNFIISTKEVANKSVCQKVLGVNPKIWYDLEQRGQIPTSGTYDEYFKAIIKYYQNRQEVALAKVKENGNNKTSFRDTEDYNKLQEKLIATQIKLNSSKTQQIYTTLLKDSKEVIKKEELYKLVRPFITSISSILRYESDLNPELKGAVDKCFHSIYRLGSKMIAECDRDEEAFVKRMMEKQVSMDEIMQDNFLED